ncbi:hypothetical protein ACOSQ2_006445 [Xanthoceras sorbifolium]
MDVSPFCKTYYACNIYTNWECRYSLLLPYCIQRIGRLIVVVFVSHMRKENMIDIIFNSFILHFFLSLLLAIVSNTFIIAFFSFFFLFFFRKKWIVSYLKNSIGKTLKWLF